MRRKALLARRGNGGGGGAVGSLVWAPGPENFVIYYFFVVAASTTQRSGGGGGGGDTSIIYDEIAVRFSRVRSTATAAAAIYLCEFWLHSQLLAHSQPKQQQQRQQHAGEPPLPRRVRVLPHTHLSHTPTGRLTAKLLLRARNEEESFLILAYVILTSMPNDLHVGRPHKQARVSGGLKFSSSKSRLLPPPPLLLLLPSLRFCYR